MNKVTSDTIYKCPSCEKLFDADKDDNDICLSRGVYCGDCCREQESLKMCREQGCDMCDAIYKAERGRWYKCQCCRELKEDVDEDRVCGDCHKEATIQALMANE
jgi:hypothetical protein